MRKTNLMTLLVVLAVGGAAAVYLADPVKLLRGVDVDSLARAFLEDLQFKDFRQSGLYHHTLEQDRLDIGRALERLFMLKPEFIDIQQYRIIKSEVDSAGQRARTLVRVRFKRLNMANEPEDKDLILYWMRRHPECPLGGRCGPQRQCLDERQQVMFKPLPPKDKRTEQQRALYGDVDTGLSEDPYTCDPEAQPRWFMNLDSTLESKSYKPD